MSVAYRLLHPPCWMRTTIVGGVYIRNRCQQRPCHWKQCIRSAWSQNWSLSFSPWAAVGSATAPHPWDFPPDIDHRSHDFQITSRDYRPTQTHHVITHISRDPAYRLHSDCSTITHKTQNIPASRFPLLWVYHPPFVIFSFQRCCVKAVSRHVGPRQKNHLAAVFRAREILRDANERLYVFPTYTQAVLHARSKVVCFRRFCHFFAAVGLGFAVLGVVITSRPPPFQGFGPFWG